MNNFRVWPIKDKEYTFRISIKSFDSGCKFTWNGEYFDLETSLTLQEVRDLKSSVERAEEAAVLIYGAIEGPGAVDFSVGNGPISRNPCGEIFGGSYPADTVDINGRKWSVTGGDFSNDLPMDAGLS